MHEDQPPRSSPSSAVPIVLIVVAVVGGLFFVCAGVIVVCLAAISVLGTNASAKFNTVATKIGEGPMSAESEAESFLTRIEFNNDAAAYEMTSMNFRRQYTREEFVAFVNRSPLLRRNRDSRVSFHSATAEIGMREGTRATCKATIEGYDKDTMTATIHLVKEGGQWKVDQFTVP